jgi:ankyrin repeat protein
MKKLFTAIRKHDLELVKQIIEKKPELVNCVAKQPPKKDDGQSPLQVALKTENIEIANYLLDMGADVNFIESETCCNEWRAPVIQDAITCAVMCSRWSSYNKYNRSSRVFSTKERANDALALLKRIIASGADINAKDSFGIDCLGHFASQADQILPYPLEYYKEDLESYYREFTEEVHEDLRCVLRTLKDAGVDVNYRHHGYSVREFFSKKTVSILFDEVFGRDLEKEVETK